MSTRRTWFKGHKDNIAPTTQESYKYCLKMLKEGFYHRPLTVIRPIDIENFLKGMQRDGRLLTPHSCRHTYAILFVLSACR
ncbi:MAG: hypothetical protein ACLRUY_09000 [Faecalibacterium prausnitzii]